MKKVLSVALLLAGISIASCGGGKQSAKDIAAKWCDLNGKVFKAAEGAEKDAAKAARENFENEIEAKYKGDEAFMKEVEQEVEKCEAASEGK